MNRFFSIGIQLFYALLITAVLLLIITRVFFLILANPKTFDLSQAPVADTAIIFGAGLRRDGTPTPVLRDRVKAGAELYNAGKVKRLLLSGASQHEKYNEPAAMAAYAQELGIPASALIEDEGGRSTYDSCIRAKQIFNLDNVLLVTQSFHLPRALFICSQLGINSNGVSADLRNYWISSLIFWNLRELPAGFAAIIDTWLIKPTQRK
jgi:SanA protein